MADLSIYQTKYSRASLTRDELGILEVRLHADGGPFVWDEPAHRELPQLWRDIAHDAMNRVVILTGTGDEWCARFDASGWDFATPHGWDKVYGEGKELLQAYVDIPVPVICAVNGPVIVHSELAVMGDVVIASDNAWFADHGHFVNNMVPGDGVQIVWRRLLGPNKARYFLLTGQQLSASDALDAGVVAEVVTPDQLLARAHEIARQFADKTDLVLRNTRIAINLDLKRELSGDQLGYGLMLEASAAIDLLSKAGDTVSPHEQHGR